MGNANFKMENVKLVFPITPHTYNIMKIIYAILAAILLSFVAVQYNDPDPILWMPIYGYGAMLLAMAAGGKYHKVATIIGIVGYSSGAIYLSPSVLEWIEKEHGQNLMQSMANSKMYIEETRECGGLMIAAVFLLFSFLQHKTKTKN